MPDTYLMADGVPLWVELKVTKNDRVSVRPSQIAWHSAHNRCGGVSFFLILHAKTGDLFSFDGGRAAEIGDSSFSDLCAATSACAIDPRSWVAALRAGLL